MKALRNHRIKFHCQLGLIGMLATVGLIAVCGEPDESLSAVAWIRTFGFQVAVCTGCWLAAWLLAAKWQINRKMALIERLNRCNK